MKRYKNLIILAAVLIVVIAESVFAYNKLAEKAKENETSSPAVQLQERSNTAANFTVYDINGKAVELTDELGKPVVVNFWATWCPPCKEELPHFNSLYEKYGDRVDFMMVNLTDGSRETVESVTKFTDENKYIFPVYFDRDASAAKAYGVSSIPVTLFIDKNGYLIESRIGAMDENTIERYIKEII